MSCNISCKFCKSSQSLLHSGLALAICSKRAPILHLSRISSRSIMDIYFSLHFYHFSMAPPRTASKRGKLPAPRRPVTRRMGARTPQRGVSGPVATRSETGQCTSASNVTTSGHGQTDAAASYPVADERPLSAVVTTSIVELIKQTVSDELRSALLSMQETQLGTGSQRVEGQEPLPCDLPLPSVSFETPPTDSPQLMQSTWALDGGEHDIISCDNSTMQAPGEHAIPDSFPIDAHVTDSLKQKIWSNEFIELSQLLKGNSEPEHFNITMSSGSGVPSLCLLPKKRQGISSIDQWNTAFTIFMSVYLTKFPLEAKAILKYSETVNVLQKKGGNFLAFDENVRYLRQCKLSAWDTFHTEQYVEAMTQFKQPTSSTPSPTGRQIPRGFCFEHHEGRRCDGCRHNHRCPWCGGSHPATKCPGPNTRQSDPRGYPLNQPFRGQFAPTGQNFGNQRFRPQLYRPQTRQFTPNRFKHFPRNQNNKMGPRYPY